MELEQAYVEYDWAENQSLKAGLYLLPVGILPETHEPATFYGVERNPVETYIIPSTWWEGGLAFSGGFADAMRYDFVITSYSIHYTKLYEIETIRGLGYRLNAG